MGESTEGVTPPFVTMGSSGWPVRTQAPHIGHGTHLCHMAESGEFTLEQIKKVIGTPKYICKICGRAAEKEDNLCSPVAMTL